MLQTLIETLNTRFGTRLHVQGVENNYFGGDVSVAGLLTGADLISARDLIRGNFIIIPRQMLKSDEEVMLDGTELKNLREEFNLPIHAVDLKSFELFVAITSLNLQ